MVLEFFHYKSFQISHVWSRRLRDVFSIVLACIFSIAHAWWSWLLDMFYVASSPYLIACKLFPAQHSDLMHLVFSLLAIFQGIVERVYFDMVALDSFVVVLVEYVLVIFCFLQFLVLVMFHFLNFDVIDSKLRRYKHVFSLFFDICGYTFDYCFPLLEFNTRMWLRGEVLRILYCILVRR